MNTPAERRWDKVEFWTSYFLLTVLAGVIILRLSFADVWSVPHLDIVISSIALALIALSPWIARRSRLLRILFVVYGAGTQLVPVTLRHPEVLYALIGGLIPVVIVLWALIALTRKGQPGQGSPRS